MALNPRARTSATTLPRGLSITINPKVMTRITKFPQGVQWRQHNKVSNPFVKNFFFLKYEYPIEEKNGIKMENLPYPWNEVSYYILKYISCEGRLNIVYVYQFRLLHELIFGEELPFDKRLSVPYLFFKSIIDMNLKVEEGKHTQLAHHGLIKLILEDVLSQLRIHILWSMFRDMDREVVIEIQALEYDRDPTSSGEEEAGEDEE